MPTICRFDGIEVWMHRDDHGPPHFHVVYAEYQAVVEIAEMELLEGNLPPRIRRKVLTWARSHSEELTEDWELAHMDEPLKRIPPPGR